MAWRIAFILWSGENELGINCYYLVNSKGNSKLVYGDDELYAMRSRIDNYKIHKRKGVKEIYTHAKHYMLACFETKLDFITEDYFQLKDILVYMYPYRVYVGKSQGLSLQDIVKNELSYLLSGDNSYTNRGYNVTEINWLINEAKTYAKN